MVKGFNLMWVAWVVVCCIFLGFPTCDGSQTGPPTQGHGKLLYILMDGFKWDYVDQEDASVLPAFTKFLQDGGRARWTNPLFPSLSYPTWTTLATGQYAETHGIVGNYFYDPETGDVFSLFDDASTGKEKWWTSEPIWTTAEKAGLRTAQYLWARCDVPIQGIVTEYCEHFVKIPGKAIFEENIMKALDKFDEGFDFVQVYTEHADNTGHNTGPNSTAIRQAVKDLDDVLMTLMDELEKRNLEDEVNIVIVSDHGMTYTAPGAIVRHEIDDFLDTDLVENIADKGAFMNIKIPSENVEKVFEQVSEIPGVTAYKHYDIPEQFHFKNNKYIHDIILLADEGHFIMASNSSKQLPPRNDFVYIGAHGYNPNIQDMKGIFFAKGPAFKCGWTVDPIHVVDIYQVLTHVLHLTPQTHNGTWNRVENIFKVDGDDTCYSHAPNVQNPATGLLTAVFLLILSLTYN
ncbi:glycerophosphocholine cholinephosphodiesterase ENPP6-like [Panulirus ornatus]|uniref:glycerophosphocholine cholinephosphodiesterase ENPP6-like n=1 Tax=Panulirus ornatus TaxID=150431 RepID=UPI003A8447B6